MTYRIDWMDEETAAVSIAAGYLQGIRPDMNFALMGETQTRIGAIFPFELKGSRFWSGPMDPGVFRKVRIGDKVVPIDLGHEAAVSLRRITEQLWLDTNEGKETLAEEEDRYEFVRSIPDMAGKWLNDLEDLTRKAGQLTDGWGAEYGHMQAQIANLQDSIDQQTGRLDDIIIKWWRLWEKRREYFNKWVEWRGSQELPDEYESPEELEKLEEQLAGLIAVIGREHFFERNVVVGKRADMLTDSFKEQLGIYISDLDYIIEGLRELALGIEALSESVAPWTGWRKPLSSETLNSFVLQIRACKAGVAEDVRVPVSIKGSNKVLSVFLDNIELLMEDYREIKDRMSMKTRWDIMSRWERVFGENGPYAYDKHTGGTDRPSLFELEEALRVQAEKLEQAGCSLPDGIFDFSPDIDRRLKDLGAEIIDFWEKQLKVSIEGIFYLVLETASELHDGVNNLKREMFTILKRLEKMERPLEW